MVKSWLRTTRFALTILTLLIVTVTFTISTPAPAEEAQTDQSYTSVEYPDNQQETFTLHQEIPGPGALFGRMLGALTSFSNSSENRFKLLIQGVPEVLPDLYKVFITL